MRVLAGRERTCSCALSSGVVSRTLDDRLRRCFLSGRLARSAVVLAGRPFPRWRTPDTLTVHTLTSNTHRAVFQFCATQLLGMTLGAGHAARRRIHNDFHMRRGRLGGHGMKEAIGKEMNRESSWIGVFSVLYSTSFHSQPKHGGF